MRFWGKQIRIAGDWLMYSNSPDDDNLRVNPDKDYFEENMQRILRQIQGNPVGAIVLDAINDSSRSVSLRPVAAGALSKMSSRPIIEKNAFARDSGGPNDAGAGSDVVIWFKTAGVTIQGHYYRVDDGVLHECVHALRQARGRWRPAPLAGWDNEEELFAVMVANIYASVGNRDFDMRGSHAAVFTPMRLSPGDFATQFSRSLVEFRSTSSYVYNALYQVKSAWNPIIPFEDRFWAGR